MKKYISFLLALCTLCACSQYDLFETGDGIYSDRAGESGNGDGQDGAPSGVLTAAEWNDLDNWPYWCSLMQNSEYRDHCSYWGYSTDNRLALRITDEKGEAVAGARVQLTLGDWTWDARTDNRGYANCWAGLFTDTKADGLTGAELTVEGVKYEGDLQFTHHQDEELKINEITVTGAGTPDPSVDVAFIVDATGSMSDEIDFLKSDLVDILERASEYAREMTIRSAALFYRDEGDDYITKHQDFTTDPEETADYVGKQRASGGGVYPEAVHTALEDALQKLRWNENARSRVAFLILDAPAHYTDEILESLKRSVRNFARYGIAIIPVAASGADYDTEFLLRTFAIATGGTFTFLTDDSGVGDEHLKPTVGQYEVEKLNDLITRLIQERME